MQTPSDLPVSHSWCHTDITSPSFSCALVIISVTKKEKESLTLLLLTSASLSCRVQQVECAPNAAAGVMFSWC